MITFITGMPGDGKTMFAVSQIIKRLVETERYVVTNIKMRRDVLHAHVSKLREERYRKTGGPSENLGKGPEWNIDERFCQITDAEAYEFFRFRSGGHVLESSPDMRLEEGERKMAKKDHDAAMIENFKSMRLVEAALRPVDYFIDEVHEIFPSREWDKGGRGILFYASKHRHLHDEIFLITQQVDQVEKQLRNLASETVVVRNLLRRNVGLWKARAGFKLRFFYGLPTPTAKPFMEPTMRLDLDGPASCYKTTGALGVHDKPEAVQNKGVLPYWTMWAAGIVGVLVIGAGFVFLPYAGAKMSKVIIGGVGDKAGQAVSSLTNSAEASRSSPPSPYDRVDQGETARAVAPAVGAPAPVPAPARLEVRGYAVRGSRVNIALTDGRTVTERDMKSGDRIDRHSVTLGGQTLWMMRPPERDRIVSDIHPASLSKAVFPAPEPEAKTSSSDSTLPVR